MPLILLKYCDCASSTNIAISILVKVFVILYDNVHNY